MDLLVGELVDVDLAEVVQLNFTPPIVHPCRASMASFAA